MKLFVLLVLLGFLKTRLDEMKLKKYECQVCGFIYDPTGQFPFKGSESGMPFEKLPDDWLCPWCLSDRSSFKPFVELAYESRHRRRRRVIREQHKETH